jgi:archaemetzincin
LIPGSSEHSIAISPIGEFDRPIIEALCDTVHQAFGIPAKTHVLLEDILFAWNPERRQYHSTPILEKLAAGAPPWAVKVAALVKMDLYIPILTYVYGEAQLKGRACIVSTFRLSEGISPPSTETTFQTRVGKEIIHELGHTFNLRHCSDPSCIMHYCRTEADVDRKSEKLCRYCKVLLSDEFKRMERQHISGSKK